MYDFYFRGVFGYIKQIALLRAIGRIKFARIRLDILKITAHPEDGTVRVRWRIRGIPSYKALISYIKHFSFFITHELEGYLNFFFFF